MGVWGSELRKYISIGFRCPGRSYQYGWYSSDLSSLQDLLQVVEPFCVAATRGPPPRKNGRPARPTSLEEEARRHGQLRGAKRRYRIMSLLCLFRRSGRSYPYNRCSSSCGAVFLRSGHARDPPLKAAGAARPPSKPAVGLRPFRPAPRGPPPRPALGKSGRIVSCLARTGRLWGIRGKECIRGGYPPGWPPST